MHTEDLDTPAVVIDRAIAEANLRRAQAYADEHGLPLRPHIKTHKLPYFARRQIELGAIGITCQKVGEAEVMVDAGIENIFIPYNILGEQKLERLKRLHGRSRISVSADSALTIDGYATHFDDADHPLPVLVECDTGAKRCGVQTPAEALELARRIDTAPGLRFDGLMTYPPRGAMEEVDRWLREAARLIHDAGLEVKRISNGGSPDLYSAARVTCATEHRPGTYIYSDRMQIGFGLGGIENCALTVLATVVSRPTADRAVLDSGSKALAADTCAAPGYGDILEYPGAVITTLSEEHGVVDLSACATRPSNRREGTHRPQPRLRGLQPVRRGQPGGGRRRRRPAAGRRARTRHLKHAAVVRSFEKRSAGMVFDTNPFPKGDADRHELWEMLVARDIAAFVACDWSMVEDDFLADSFFGMHAHFLHNPDSWRLQFPTLEAYRDEWLRQARETDHAAFAEPLGAAMFRITNMRDIDVQGDRGVLHKKFDGSIARTDGSTDRLNWQTLYFCRKVEGRWRIAGFVGYMPHPLS